MSRRTANSTGAEGETARVSVQGAAGRGSTGGGSVELRRRAALGAGQLRGRRGVSTAAALVLSLVMSMVGGAGIWALQRFVVPPMTAVAAAPSAPIGARGEAAPKARVLVPDLDGVSKEAAAKEVDAVGLRLVVAREVADAESVAGRVVSQRPWPGSVLTVGSSVRVSVAAQVDPASAAEAAAAARAPRDPTVPSVLGGGVGEAKAAFARARLGVGDVTEEASDDPQGTVIKQTPAAGETAPPGALVDVVVSAGPKAKMVAVPAVTKLSREAATEALTEVGLAVGAVTEGASDVDEGLVAEQSPKAGVSTAEGSAVALVVSSGKGEVKVPLVWHKPIDSARTTLGAAGFRVTVREVWSDDYPKGTVVQQIPSAGQMAAPGSTVALSIVE